MAVAVDELRIVEYNMLCFAELLGCCAESFFKEADEMRLVIESEDVGDLRNGEV